MEATLTALHVENTLLQMRNLRSEDEAKAFRKFKMLNAFAGSAIQGVGTGLQLDKSIHVQRGGDIIGVVGNAASIFFAVCTAELDHPDKGDEPGLDF
jgi:hypothetical protein